MLEDACIVVQAEQERADDACAGLVPAKAGDDALGGARVLDLDHRALARLVRLAGRFGDYAVQARALELREPLGSRLALARRGGEVNRGFHAPEGFLEAGAPGFKWLAHQGAALVRKKVECNERSRRFLGELGYARGSRMQAKLQRVKVEAARTRDDDLAVEHASGRQPRRQGVVQVG